MSDAQKLTARDAEVLWAIRAFFEANRYKSELKFDEVLKACPENIVAGVLRPILERLVLAGFLGRDPRGLFSLTPLGLGVIDKRNSFDKGTFTAFCDLLLVALADYTDRQSSGKSSAAVVELEAIAKAYNLSFAQGWIRRASQVFASKPWADVEYSLGQGEDGGIHAILNGMGLLEAESLRKGLLERGIIPPAYPPLDNVESVKTSTVPSAGTAPTFISSDGETSSVIIAVPVPAADRFVEIDHNSQSFQEAKESIEKVITAVRQANDLFATEGERLFVERELSDLEKLFQGDVLRIAAIKQYTEGSGTIAYLYQKGKDAVVGNAAWECLKAIGKFIAECLRFD